MNKQYKRIKNLFLQQSYLDSWEDYARSLRKVSFIKWDYLLLTASNEAQAESYRRQIQLRLENHQLPDTTEYIVLPDPDGKRVGSGGATINALCCIAGKEKAKCREKRNPFKNRRILVIHSGGDSKRVPQYSVCGKLFSPIPRELPDGRPSTLFDELVIGLSGVPSRIKDGMLILSGDVLLLFNPLQIDFQFCGAAGITMKQPADVGKEHGVFLNDGENYVRRFLHKHTVADLGRVGAIDGQGTVDLDTGAVLCDCDLLAALYSLVCTDGVFDQEKFDRFVNEDTRISFYGDFLYPLARDSTLEEYYRQEPEGDFTESLHRCRTEIWNALRGFSMKLFTVSPAEFIHFGTTRELLKLVAEAVDSYEFLGWKRSVLSTTDGGIDFAANNSVIEHPDRVGSGAYVENSFLKGGVLSGAGIGKRTILSNVVLSRTDIPEDCVLSGIWLKDGGCVVRIYGVCDNPKQPLLLDAGLDIFAKKNNLTQAMIWKEDDQKKLWTALLYPVGKTMDEAVGFAMTVYRMAKGTATAEEVESWKNTKRESLCSSFNNADNQRMLDWRLQLENYILVDKFANALKRGEDYKDALGIFGNNGINEEQYRLLLDISEKASFYERIKILYSFSRYMKDQNKRYGQMSYDEIERLCFKEIRDTVCSNNSAETGAGSFQIREDTVSVDLPVRVNWGGGWTDTPPYCNEHGGVVINAAIKLKGVLPIQARARRLRDIRVEFESEDIGAFGRINSLEEIRSCHDPYDSFALHKAALLAYGVIPPEGGETLEDILRQLGGGIYLSTRVVGVPKGSGLGTSSILAGACVMALGRLFGEDLSDNEIYEKVLCMEQIMSTGGGWQDQVGGITPGIKFISTEPGLAQRIRVEPVRLSERTKKELQERFALIYTGQRRLARNLLRKVLGGYLSGRRDSVLALKKMPEVAALMRFELERGNLDAFAELLNKHWDLSVQLDPGTTNTCIDQIFMTCEDMIDGKFIAGAGGGGFLMVVLKKGVTRAMLRERLCEVFHDNGVEVWDSEFVY